MCIHDLEIPCSFFKCTYCDQQIGKKQTKMQQLKWINFREFLIFCKLLLFILNRVAPVHQTVSLEISSSLPTYLNWMMFYRFKPQKNVCLFPCELEELAEVILWFVVLLYHGLSGLRITLSFFYLIWPNTKIKSNCFSLY